MRLSPGRFRPFAIVCILVLSASPARAADLTTWPLRTVEGTRTTETADGFTLQPPSPGSPFGFTLQASRATADSAGSDTKVGPVRWMAPESISGITATGGFGFADGSQEFLRLDGTAGATGMRFDLSVLGDRLGQGAVHVVALENGSPIYSDPNNQQTSPLFEGSNPPTGAGAVGSSLGAAFEPDFGGNETPRPPSAERPGGGAIALRFPSGTTLVFGGTVVTADEVRVGIWGTTGTLFDTEELAVTFTPASGTAPSIDVIGVGMGLNGHELRLGAGARGEIVRDADGRARLALEPSPEGSARVSTTLRPGQQGVTLRWTEADGSPLASPPLLVTQQGRVLDASSRRAEIVYGVRATSSGDGTIWEPVLDDPGAVYTVRWTLADGTTGSSTPSSTFPGTTSHGAWPSEWTLPALGGNDDEVGVILDFAAPVDLTVGTTAVSGATRMRIEILMTLTADPLIGNVETDVTGLTSGPPTFISYVGSDLGPGASDGAPTAKATGRAFIQRADDGTVLVGGLAPGATDPVDGVEFAFAPTTAAGIEFVTDDERGLAFRCGGEAVSDPTLLYDPIEILLEPQGGDEYAVRFDARAITDLEEIAYEVLDGDGVVLANGNVVHRDIAARNVGRPRDATVASDGGVVTLSVKFERPTASRAIDVDTEVRVTIPQSDFRARTLQLASDGGAFFARGRTLATSTDAPRAHARNLRLHRPVPNPFNPRTSVRFDLQEAAKVSLRIHDTRGRVVRVLADGWLDAGAHTRVWNGTDDRGRAVASGTYFVRLSGGSTDSQARRLTLVR